jgi:L-methionine (R)-S-oxide reductase
MAEETLDLRHMQKQDAYATLNEQIRAVLEGIEDPIAAMATMSALVHHAFGHLWTGFYRVVEPGRLLRVGPYQGTLGCLDIAFGRGVCGTCAVQGTPIIVPDVHAFPDHIACDARARSEIVLPVVDGSGALIAVFDVDSAVPNAFTEEDAAGLGRILERFAESS